MSSKTRPQKRQAEAAELGTLGWLRDHRHGLGPAYVAALVLVAGVVANTLLSGVQLFLLAAVGTVAAGIAILMRVEQTWRQSYLGIVVVFSVAWVVWAANVSTLNAWTWLITTLTIGSVILGVPHWLDRVQRTQVHMERMIRQWPIRSARIGLGESDIVNVRYNEIGNWSATLTWQHGQYMVDQVRKQQLAIEAALGLDQGQLEVDFNGKSNNSVKLSATLNDPHAKGIMWSIPTHEVEGQGTMIDTLHGADAFEIGVRSDGTVKKLKLFKQGWGARQLLIAGIKGSGKSGLLNRIWAQMALCDDVVQWGVDLKGGAELGPWRGVFDWVVTTRDEAIEMVTALMDLVDRRNSLLAKYGWKSWEGSPENPWVVFSVDEARRLLGNMSNAEADLIANLATTARSAGVCIIWSTQYPTLEALGSSQIREQIDQRFCFRMQNSTGEGYVLDFVVNAHKIDADRPGTCYHQDADKLDPNKMRVMFVGDGSSGTRDLIKIIVSLLTGKTPELDQASIENGIENLEAYANRERPELDREHPAPVEPEGETLPEWNENADVPLDSIVGLAREAMTPEEREAAETADREAASAEEAGRLSPDAAREAVLTALEGAGRGGVSAAELAKLATRKHTWTHDLLVELEEQGKVKRNGEGKWFMIKVTQLR
jgi:S-DNA-T family DNA segregation ATPase FtsK/SpoIIIE